MNNKEDIFTKTELEKIESFAEKNQELRNPLLINLAMKYSEIMTMSPIKGLILVKGNQFTGFEHIRIRHERWTNSPNWIESINKFGDKNFRLQQQSLFRKDSTPIFDYCNIADSVYTKENLNLEQNKNKELFDLYIGFHKHSENSNEKYKLVLYKNTKIIHTLYPQSRKNNPTKVKGFNLVRKSVSGNWDLKNCIVEIRIPYENQEKKITYLVLIRKLTSINLEKAYIQINRENGTPWKTMIIGQRVIKTNNQGNITMGMETMYWQFADLRYFEKKILEFEKNEQK